MKKRKHSAILCAGMLTVSILLMGCQGGIDKRTGGASNISDTLSEKQEVIQEQESSEEAARREEMAKQSSGHASRYVYTTLDGEGQKVYAEIYATIIAHDESVEVSTLDKELLDEAYRAVMADYGELFWVSGYVYTQYMRGDVLESLEFAPSYTMTEEERQSIQTQIDTEVAEILAGISRDASDYEKTRYVFDYLAENIDYVMGAQENQNIISVFVYGQTVCQGYADATQYLLSELDVQSAVVTGEADGNSHAWNLVRMDGEYYYVDTTWGNSTYANEESESERFINYNYFGVTTEELFVTHQPDDNFVLPECTATQDNYYIREGKYFTEWSPDAVGTLCREGYELENTAVSVKFATEELYNQTKQYFIDEQHIADYCSGISTFYYIEDTEQNVLTFRF